MSERFTVRLDEDAAEWVDAEADARDRSKAWVIQEAVDAARGTDSVFTDAERTAPVRTGANLTDRLDALEERLTDLETGRDEPAAEPTEEQATERVDSVASDTPTTESAEPTDGVTGQPAPREPSGVDEAGGVGELLAGWSPGRDREERQERRALGQQVLEWFRETEGYVSATDVKDALYPQLAYADESADTWWRKIGRPPMSAAVEAGLAEYREGYHDYRWLGDGETAEDDDTGGIYDPTEEF